MQEDITLSAQFKRALATASEAFNLPTIEDKTQDLIRSALADLRHVDARASSLSLFSANETLEDISTRDLAYLFVPYVITEVQGRVRTLDMEERLAQLLQAQRHLRTFLTNLENYHIITEVELAAYEKSAAMMANAAQRREAKIQQYRREKELRGKIEASPSPSFPLCDRTPNDFDLITSLLSRGSEDAGNSDDEDDVEDALREVTLLLLRLIYAQARQQNENLTQELELVRNALAQKSASKEGEEDGRRKQEEDAWRLDSVPRGGPDGRGPLLDSSGRPLRPFTILPSNAAERARLQAEVFGPDHRLPTMTVDEYLEIERQRGNVITGGGPQSAEKLTTSEQLALDAEMDGTVFGEQKVEEKRQKDEKWAQYTDTHPKGAGNTMNRG
ncbi:TAP42-like protein [Gloeophyllum trabeum ATCC 11539]|uniref:TAP42-like protein n=1 Tax=Gloeophyllum trabeum (strain ATCC 11539 / FP-39264 / Madison 617) TaxID=670483 RepID=S7RX08_GLOTA|nr:TAP42-like protein [Gloeophyllum trabeum ATCC 11539]EPQ57884.1 TAP42-like protein [Gloeophyllum trabeum ATCC 11539]